MTDKNIQLEQDEKISSENIFDNSKSLDQIVDEIREEVGIWLSDYKIFKKSAKTNKVFALLEKNFMSNTDIPSEYVKTLWEKYQNLPKRFRENSTNGNVFEAIIITALLKSGISPMYIETKMAFVPNVIYDIVVFPKSAEGEIDVAAPIVISIKTSLRERYKQADLEGIALKNVYKRGKSYLVTLDDKNTINLHREQIFQKEIIGIDDFIDAKTIAFDELIKDLQCRTVAEPPLIKVIEDSLIIEKA